MHQTFGMQLNNQKKWFIATKPSIIEIGSPVISTLNL